MIIYSIYKVVNRLNGKIYIGFDSKWPRRQITHKSHYRKINYKFYFAIRKSGWENFEWQVIYQSKEREHTLQVMENYFITEYNSFSRGYNSTLGGEGVFGLHRKQTLQEKEKRRLSMIGNQMGRGNKGKFFSEERKEKLKKPRINDVKPLSTEHKQNISKSKVGKPKEKIQCTHCIKTGGLPQMKRWHFENCKSIQVQNVLI